MSANHHRAYWEDVTNDTPLVFSGGCVQFTSVVSASFWLVECPNWMSSDALTLVDQLYRVGPKIPIRSRFRVIHEIVCVTEA
jgi:hypothetical protein